MAATLSSITVIAVLLVAVVTAVTPAAAATEINPGAVTTFAGSGQQAVVDGTGAQASFSSMGGVAVMNGTVYVADGSTIRAVNTTTGQVTTIAGSASTAACTGGTSLLAAHFTDLRGLANDGTSLFAADFTCNMVFKVNISTGVVTMISSGFPSPPTGVAYVLSGALAGLYAVGPGLAAIEKIDIPTKTYSSFAATNGAYGITGDQNYLWANELTCTSGCSTTRLLRVGTSAAEATFTTSDSRDSLTGTGQLAMHAGFIYTSGPGPYPTAPVDAGLIELPMPTGASAVIAATTVAGTNSPGYADGTGTDAWFSGMQGVASDGTNLWIADKGNHRLRKVTAGTALPVVQPATVTTSVNISSAKVSTFAGSGSFDAIDGYGTAAGLANMSGAVVVGATLYFASNQMIRGVDLHTGRVFTLVGSSNSGSCTPSSDPASAGIGGDEVGLSSDGHYLYAASFHCTAVFRISLSTGATSIVTEVQDPNGVTVGPDGWLYVVGKFLTAIKKVNPATGAMTDFVSSIIGAYDITSDSTYLWATEIYTCGIVTYAGCNTRLLRVAIADGTTTRFDPPGEPNSSLSGSASLVSAGGYLYTTGFGDSNIIQIPKPSGAAGTITGSSIAGTTTAGYADGSGSSASFNGIVALASDGTSLWADDFVNGRIRRLTGGVVGAPVSSTEAPAGTNPSMSCACNRAEARQQVTRAPVNVRTGNFWHTFDDLAIPGRGYGLDVERTYNSDPALSAEGGAFGRGWSWSYGMTLNLSGSTATVKQEDGSQVSFTQSGSSWVSAAPRYLAMLVHNGDGTWTMTRNSRQTLTFDSLGRLAALRDLNGNTTTVQYPSDTSRVVTDPAGRTLTFTLSGGVITLVADTSTPARTVQYQYNDGLGNLTDAIDVTGGHWQFTYDTSHRLLTMRSPRYYGSSITTPPPVVTNTYDTQGRVSSQTDQLGRTTSFDYSVANSTIVTYPNPDPTQPNHNITLYNYDPDTGTLAKVTKNYDPNNLSQGVTWQYLSDASTLGASEEIDPNGHASFTYYDASGNVTTTVDALGRVTRATYDTLNDVTSTTDGNGVTTTMVYDTAGNVQTKSTPLLDDTGAVTDTATTTFFHEDPSHPGDVTKVEDPTHRLTHLAYDSYGDLTSATDALGDETTYGYNTATGWRTSSVAPKGNVTGGNQAAFTTAYSYDNAGRVTQVKDPLWSSAAPTAHQQTRHYDADGNIDYTINGDNNRTDFTYDPAEELTVTTRSDSTTLRTDYNAAGSVKDQLDGLNHLTVYSYDPLGRVATSTDPLNNMTTYAYDGVGNLVTRQAPGGNCAATPRSLCTVYGYDAADQLSSITYSDGTTPNVTNIDYDGDGRRTVMTDGTGTSTWKWDSLGRLTKSVNGAGSTMQYGYDLADRVTSVTYPNGQPVSRGYDDAGRWQTVTDFKGNVTTFDRDANSNITGTVFPGAAGSDASQFDNTDAMTGVAFASGSPATTFGGIVYSRGGADELLSESQFGLAGGNHTYSYTALNQLASNNRSAVIDAAINTSAAVKNNNSAWDWGDDTAGQIGNGAAGGTVTAPFPLGSPLNSGVTAIAGGQLESFNLALRSDGTVWAWGDNSNGELGDGTTTQRNSPVQVGGVSSAVAVAGGGWHSVALRADGTVWDWGGNAYGQLGNGSTASSTVPVQVPGVSGATAVAAGEFHTVAVDTAGRLWAWGRNASGQLGDGTTTDRHAPVQLAGLADVVGVAAGNAHTLAVRSDGTVWAWGTNSGGQLGNPACTTAAPCLSPTQVPGLSGIVSVGAGSFFSFAIDRQGRLWAWGANVYGQLGDGTTTQRNTPVLVGGISGVSAVSGGLHHAVATAAGGKVYAWGDNSSGQLGNAACTSLAPCHTPTLVTGMNATGVANYAVTYDQADNATQFPRGAAQGFDAADRMCWSTPTPASGTCAAPPTGSTAYSYNARGDQTAMTPPAGLATSYGYDLADRLTSYTKGTTSWSYSYDGDGLRASKAPSGGAAVPFTYDEAEGLPLILSDGSSYYVTGPGGLPLEQTDLSGNPVAYYHHDQIGSTRALTSPSGAVSTFSYNPWGQLGASSGTQTTPFGWAGQYADAESGLVWLRARYYNPATGQFLTRDPLAAVTRQQYGYASDDPLNGVDLTGLETTFTYYVPGSRLPSMSDEDWRAYRDNVAVMNATTCLEEHGYRQGLEDAAREQAFERRMADLEAWMAYTNKANKGPGFVSGLWQARSFDPTIFANVVYEGGACVAGGTAGAEALGAITSLGGPAATGPASVVGAVGGCLLAATDAKYTSSTVR